MCISLFRPRLRWKRLFLLTVLLCMGTWIAIQVHEGHARTLQMPTLDHLTATFDDIKSNLARRSKMLTDSGSGSLPVCKIDVSVDLVGETVPSRLAADPATLMNMYPFLQPGGRFSPDDCLPRENMALIIPFRNRHAHLYVLLRTLMPMLIRQKLKFSIYVIEQNEPTPFNKGTLYNAAVLEALSRDPDIDCFIFHDVDMLPLSDHNIYTCDPTAPLHFVHGVDKWKYNLLYETLTGGVMAFTKEQYQMVNGYSNLFFGWGCEDDDMTTRIERKLGGFHRKPKDVGKYDMLRHRRDRGWEVTNSRMDLLKQAAQKIDEDGLNNVAYHVTWSVQSKLFTWIKVDVILAEVFKNAPKRLIPYLQTAFKEYKEVFGDRVPGKNVPLPSS